MYPRPIPYARLCISPSLSNPIPDTPLTYRQVTESILTNISCFLTLPHWKLVFCSTIQTTDPLSSRSQIIINLWNTLTSAPGIFKEVFDLISSPTVPSSFKISDLEKTLHWHRDALLEWHDQWHSLLYTSTSNPLDKSSECHFRKLQSSPDVPFLEDMSPYPLLSPNPDPDLPPDKKLEIHGTWLTCIILKTRLLVSVNPQRYQYLEEETQRLAEAIMRIRDRCRERPSLQGGLFMTQTIWIARATVGTRESWRGATEREEWTAMDGRETGGMIAKQRFEEWCLLLGRRG
jgi:hypothetical protein